MNTPTRSTPSTAQRLFWPLLIVGVGLAALLLSLDVFPPPVADLVARAWPAALILVGLALLLAQIPPLRRWAVPLTLLITALLLAGVITTAYATRADLTRDENVVSVTEPLPDDLTRLRVQVETLATAVEILPALEADAAAVEAQFTGSLESEIESGLTVDGGTGVFLLRETQPNPIPMLADMGRGALRLALPVGVPITLDFAGADGTVSLNLLGLTVDRLNVTLSGGDLLLSLSDVALAERGSVLVENGALSVFVPDDLGVHLFMNRGGPEPEFPAADYLYLRDDSLQSVDYNDFAARSEITLTVPRGVIRIE